MKYREHRGNLKSSMETTIEIEGTKESLYNVILDSYDCTIDMLHVSPYGGIDERTGWDTHIVTVDGYGVFGFTDGDLKQNELIAKPAYRVYADADGDLFVAERNPSGGICQTFTEGCKWLGEWIEYDPDH